VSVMMIHELPGATAATMDGFKQAGLVDAVRHAPGFGGHWSGPSDTGYRIIELWDSRESWRAWFEASVAPILPDPPPAEPTFVDLNDVITAAEATDPVYATGEHVGTWAQLVTFRVQPGQDPQRLIDAIVAMEQPDSGLVREMFLLDQKDPLSAYAFAVFRNEGLARARETDPRRDGGRAALRATLADVVDGKLAFVDLDLVGELRG